MVGSNIQNQAEVFDEQGNGSSDNYPGARAYGVGWYDSTTLRQYINNACIPLVDCSADSAECTLKCNDNTSLPVFSSIKTGEQSPCLIDGDLIVNGSVLETPTIAIVGVNNVTGDVRLMGSVTVKLTSGAALHVEKCLVLDEESSMVVVVSSNAQQLMGVFL